MKNANKKQHILLELLNLSKASKKVIKYEDVIVQLFRKYPGEFHLRGYLEYPDTSNQTFYALKRDGLIQIRNKFISLTEKGIEYAKNINTKDLAKSSYKISRDMMMEIERILKTEAFSYFINGKTKEIIDSDFFSYIGTTVRSERNDFEARIKTIEDLIKVIGKEKKYSKLVELNSFMIDKFKGLIQEKKDIGYPKRGNKNEANI